MSDRKQQDKVAFHDHGTTVEDSVPTVGAEGHGLGLRRRKVDGAAKATGKTLFADDISLPGMLHAKIKRSTRAHAKILSLDTSAAEAMEGVFAVVTGADMPTPYGIIPWTKDEQALCTDKVRFIGDGIAAVAAVSIHRARTAGDEGVTVKVRHDFGRLLFGFSFFWGYIWFCQFMLIWYANLPEEIGHYATRMSASWGALFWLNLIMNFALPFLFLLPAGRKRHEGWLLQVSLLVVIVRLLDVYLLVEPSLLDAPTVPVYHVAAAVFVAVGAIALAQSRGARLAPTPRTKERVTTS